MAQNPDIQRKAQEEVDRVIGPDRLPSLEDRESLPYVEAMYREVLRWRPALPLCMPHASTEDAIYNEYFIPKGTLRLHNTSKK